MPYKFIEGLTIADVAFVATGTTLNELFASAGLALTATMIKDPAKIENKIEKNVELENDNIDMLLFSFLEELVFLKDADLLIFNKFDVFVKKRGPRYALTATLRGDKLDPTRQQHLTDVKAVTLHHFKVEKTKTGWSSQVVLDI